MKIHTKTLLILTALCFTHLVALYAGSSMQATKQAFNSHAHLSDVSDAIHLGEYFTHPNPSDKEHTHAARATRAIIFRILAASTPGPNSKQRLIHLEQQLLAQYPRNTADDTSSR